MNGPDPSDVLGAVTEILGGFFGADDPREVFCLVLDHVLTLTGGEYGFVAEVRRDLTDQPYLSSWAVSDIAWNDETRAAYRHALETGEAMEFHNLDTLFGWALREGRPIVTNDAPTDPRRGGLPPGHPPMASFLGLPLHRDDELVGLIAVANRPGGFDDAIVAALQPVAVATAAVVTAYRTARARRLAEEIERDALALAERASRTKTEFLSRVSHELRTPLNSILGFAQILEMRNLDPDDTVAVTNIRRAGEHLLRLVQDLIDVSQVEAGALAVDTESVPLGPIVEQVRRLTAHEAERGTVTLVTRIDDVEVHADPTRLVQVLVNVVSNAVKYSPAGSVVGLTTARVGTDVHIRVADAGPGIPAEARDRLFEPFDRLGAERSHVPGSGIGLTVARQLVTAMHGRLELTSSSPEGSVFTVTLPAA